MEVGENIIRKKYYSKKQNILPSGSGRVVFWGIVRLGSRRQYRERERPGNNAGNWPGPDPVATAPGTDYQDTTLALVPLPKSLYL